MLRLLRWITAGANRRRPFREVAFAKGSWVRSCCCGKASVLQDIPAEAYKDVPGVFYGWLNGNAVLGVQTRHGKGAMLLTSSAFSSTRLMHTHAA